jgi:hypothetical protein
MPVNQKPIPASVLKNDPLDRWEYLANIMEKNPRALHPYANKKIEQ